MQLTRLFAVAFRGRDLRAQAARALHFRTLDLRSLGAFDAFREAWSGVFVDHRLGCFDAENCFTPASLAMSRVTVSRKVPACA